ncbi:MAG: DegV family protein [Wenzhouxiangellaceae bacterium]
MQKPAHSITYVDAPRLRRALMAGIAHVLERRDHINRINVFPVPDSDTGTNLAFTLRSVQEALNDQPQTTVAALLRDAADAAVDGARGNSGAIMAQFFQGLREGARRSRRLNARRLAAIVRRGARSAWTAMSQPVAGTLPTVLQDFADELVTQVNRGRHDIRQLLERGLSRAQKSLANTPNLLPALKDAGVVDAGGQGFVDFLEGIVRYIREGHLSERSHDSPVLDAQPAPTHDTSELTYRYCTECLITGTSIDRDALREQLGGLAADSLVIAGSRERLRVHIHTNQPAQVFLTCETHGQLSQQKADDMRRQHRLLNQPGSVAVVCDSGADLPSSEVERLGIHVVPLRLNLADQEYLDGVSLTPDELYQQVDAAGDHPQTSQPPPGDFRRQYELLTDHQYDVVSLHLSGKLSGTLQAAEAAAGRCPGDSIHVVDTLNASAGQGLLVLLAGEAAAAGHDPEFILELLAQYRAKTQSYAMIRDLTWGVRGGRVPRWMKSFVELLRLRPVLTNSPDGRLVSGGMLLARRDPVPGFARWLLKRMQPDRMYRLMISHCSCPDDARRLRDILLLKHDLINACWITSTGPALGVHAGPGSLVVGVQEHESWDD